MNVEMLYIRRQGRRDITVRIVGEPVVVYQYFLIDISQPTQNTSPLNLWGPSTSGWGEIPRDNRGGRPLRSVPPVPPAPPAPPSDNFPPEGGIFDQWEEDMKVQRNVEKKRTFFKITKDKMSDYNVTERKLCYVINREDGIIKAFAFPVSVWRQVEDYDKEERDFNITRHGFGFGTRYDVLPIEPAPLTIEEVALVKGTCNINILADIVIFGREVEIKSEEIDIINNRFDILDL